VPTDASPAAARLDPARYTDAQRRTAAVALELFADHGVRGTSLQMIADGLGVTKAAVYHQFRTKDDIVLAVAEIELAGLQDAVAAAEARAGSDLATARRMLLADVVEVAVRRRRWAGALQGDPAMIRLLGGHEPFVDLMTRLYSLLLGDWADSPQVAVRTAIVSAAVGATVAHPLVAGLDDETLRSELLAVTSRLLDVG
jgi:AcrR family transcriptional regulator